MNTHTSLFLFILINFLLELVFSNYKDYLNYYRGNKINSNKEKQIVGSIPNNCQCDIDPESCQYLCSCDDNCPQGIALSWKERNENTYEKENNRTYSDRCIDKNLLFKFNVRRGLTMENQTEDISKYEKRNIENFCYSIDNSKKTTNNIQSLGEIENYQKNKGQILNNIIAYLIGNENIIQGSNDNNNDNNNGNEETKNTLKYIKIPISSGPFNDNGFFILYSGSGCDNKEKVEYFIPSNYSCLQTPSEVDYNSLKSIQFEEEKKCQIQQEYIIDNDGLLNYKSIKDSCKDNNNILEVEFVLKMISYKKISNCYINIVCNNPSNPINSIFKNSIIFSPNDSNNISYRYSGYGGYLNDYPLKITDNKNVYNEFYIVGKYTNGDCRYLIIKMKIILINIYIILIFQFILIEIMLIYVKKKITIKAFMIQYYLKKLIRLKKQQGMELPLILILIILMIGFQS